MRDRSITIEDLNRLRLWIESEPEVPEDDWYKDFGSFKICGRGSLPKTFLLRGQSAKGRLSKGVAGFVHLMHQPPAMVPYNPPPQMTYQQLCVRV
jgi:hypothetical protein